MAGLMGLFRYKKGSSGYLSLLRRSLDVPHQRRQLQARQSEQCHGGEDQDCELQFEEAGGAVGERVLLQMRCGAGWYDGK